MRPLVFALLLAAPALSAQSPAADVDVVLDAAWASADAVELLSPSQDTAASLPLPSNADIRAALRARLLDAYTPALGAGWRRLADEGLLAAFLQHTDAVLGFSTTYATFTSHGDALAAPADSLEAVQFVADSGIEAFYVGMMRDAVETVLGEIEPGPTREHLQNMLDGLEGQADELREAQVASSRRWGHLQPGAARFVADPAGQAFAHALFDSLRELFAPSAAEGVRAGVAVLRQMPAEGADDPDE